MWQRHWLSVAILLLTACAAGPPGEPPAVIRDDVHSGGSVLAFSHSATLLASGGWEGGVRLWSMPGAVKAGQWKAHADSVNGLAFSADDRLLVTAGYDGELVAWRLGGIAERRVATGSPVTHMVASVQRDRVLTGHADGGVRLWRLGDFSLLDERRLHRGKVRAVAIDGERGRYASSGADGTVYTWTVGGDAVGLESPPTDAWSLAFSPDGRHLYGGTWFRLLRWDLEAPALALLRTEHFGIIRSIGFTASGDRLATISRQTDSSVYFLDPGTAGVTRRFRRHALCGAAVAVSPDDRFLATTGDDASVRVWNLEGETAPALR